MGTVPIIFPPGGRELYTPSMEHPGAIVVLDFGGQYAHLIARRVRQCGVYSQILPAETPAESLTGTAGIILSGGPQSVYEEGSPQGVPEILDLGIPILGICYGMQWMVRALGGEVSQGTTKEYGRTEISHSGSLLSPCPEKFTVWMSHGDEVADAPGFDVIATSDACDHAAIACESKKIYGLQFHPEVTHTEHGQDILKSFVEMCGAQPWSVGSYKDNVAEEIRSEVSDRNVFMLVSGGVDSTVAFTLLNSVLGPDRVQGLLVDTGMMRKGEVEEIRSAFDELSISNLKIEDASEEFFANLEGVTEPEEKRKIIGNTFLDVQRRVSEEMGLQSQGEAGWMLGQGTIYPDTIETGRTAHADQIKTHHNRVDAVEKMIEQGLVIEPLKDLYKDEVRELGEELGLPHDLVWRQPFPGPGLGVRILCEAVSGQRSAVSDGISTNGVLYSVLPIRSVGVQGDGRTYRQAVALYSDSPCVVLDAAWDLATAIPNSNPEINRVLQCTSHIEPVSLTSHPVTITRARADLLREVDAIVTEEMRRAGYYEQLWQFPVVLIPVSENETDESIVLRPVESQEAMTANAAHLSEDCLQKMTSRITALDGISHVFLDLTHKPPGTIEWE